MFVLSLRRASALSRGGQINYLIISITIVVVAIPEGLPLSVSISLAYSVGRMQKDNNLVRVLSACETMGGATNICSDKTGTLTENLMTVTQGYFAGRSWSQLPAKSDFEMSYFDTLVDSIASNSRAELGKELPNGRTEVIGNKTEGAMLLFLRTLGVDYVEQRARLDTVRSFPFSSAKKRMSTLVRAAPGGNEGRLYLKGASEIVTGMCSSYMAKDGSMQVGAAAPRRVPACPRARWGPRKASSCACCLLTRCGPPRAQDLGDQMKDEIMAQITAMAGEGLRTIGIAYCNVPVAASACFVHSFPPSRPVPCAWLAELATGGRSPVAARLPSRRGGPAGRGGGQGAGGRPDGRDEDDLYRPRRHPRPSPQGAYPSPPWISTLR